MSIVSYRLYCEYCDSETVLRKSEMDSASWSVTSLPYHEGVCPECEERPTAADTDDQIELEQLDNIGETGAQNLREAGLDSTEAIAEASDAEILDVSWVGEKGLFSLKEAAKQHPPQQRWEN